MDRSIATIIVVSALLAWAQTAQSVGAWQIPAAGPALSADAVAQLYGKTCWGFFDKGTNEEKARGAIFLRFSPTSPVADYWRKWGKDAEAAAHRDDPDGYDYQGKTTVAQLTPAATEMAMRILQSRFDLFLRPTSAGVYSLRFVAMDDGSRGAVGELHCR